MEPNRRTMRFGPEDFPAKAGKEDEAGADREFASKVSFRVVEGDGRPCAVRVEIAAGGPVGAGVVARVMADDPAVERKHRSAPFVATVTDADGSLQEMLVTYTSKNGTPVTHLVKRGAGTRFAKLAEAVKTVRAYVCREVIPGLRREYEGAEYVREQIAGYFETAEKRS